MIEKSKRTVQRRNFLAHTAGLGLTALTGRALAQTAEPPLKIIVPFPPGGHPDAVARILSAPLGQLLQRPVIVENRTGAGGLVGAQAVLRSPADGNTMIMNTASSAVFAALTRDPAPFDPNTAFESLAMLGMQPLALAVGPSVRARKLGELIEEAKAASGKFSYGSAGVGSLTHVIAEFFKQQAGGIPVEHVPYRGSLAAVTDLAGDRIQMVIDTLSTMQQFVRDGRIRQLALLSPQPSSLAPGIPTARQQGVDVVASAYNILALPAGVPRDRAAPLLAAVQTIVRRPDFQASISNLMMSIDADFGPKQCTDFIAKEVATYTPVIKSARITAN